MPETKEQERQKSQEEREEERIKEKTEALTVKGEKGSEKVARQMAEEQVRPQTGHERENTPGTEEYDMKYAETKRKAAEEKYKQPGNEAHGTEGKVTKPPQSAGDKR